MKHTKNPIEGIQCIVAIVTGILLALLFLSCDKKKEESTLAEVQIEETTKTLTQTSKTYKSILAQEKAWAAALVAGDDPMVADLATVDSLMHRDFRLKGFIGDQMPVSKEMYLGLTGMSGTFAEVTSLKIVDELGPIAVARVTWTMDWARNGVKLPRYWDMLDTWMMQGDGTWQILSRLSQPVDEPYNANQKKN